MSEIVKEHLYNLFANEIDDNALCISNKEFADLLKKKHNNSGQSCPDKNSYISTQSKGIEIRFKDKSLLKELDGDNVLEISWSMAARHIRAWEQEKESERLKSECHKTFGKPHTEDVTETDDTTATDHKEEKPIYEFVKNDKADKKGKNGVKGK